MAADPTVPRRHHAPGLILLGLVLAAALLSPAAAPGILDRIRDTALVVGEQTFAQSQAGGVELLQAEAEGIGATGENDGPDTAELLDGLGTGDGDAGVAIISGSFAGPGDLVEVTAPAASEDDGAVDLATDLGLAVGQVTTLTGIIGDGPHGSTGDRTGDVDMVAIDVPAGIQLRARLRTPNGAAIQGVLSVYDEQAAVVGADDDGAGGLAAVVRHRPSYDQRIVVAVGSSTSPRPLDPFDPASGLGVGAEGRYELEVALIDDDLDVFAVDVERGEVVAATLLDGRGRQVQLVDIERITLASTVTDTSVDYPASSPLTGGGPHLATTTPFGPRMFVAVAGRPGPYELRVEVRRPGMTQAPDGAVQTFLLDTDGAIVDGRAFGGAADAALTPLSDFLSDFGLQASDGDAVEGAALAAFADVMEDAGVGTDDYQVTTTQSAGTAGLTSTIVVGGTIGQLGASLVASAPNTDVGNFDPDEVGVVLLDTLSGPPTATASLNGIATTDRPALVGTAVGRLAARVAAEMVGARQTSGRNAEAHLMDPAAAVRSLLGVGPDGAWGTGDDVPAQVFGDALDHTTGLHGNQNTATLLATALVPGTDAVDDPPTAGDDTFTLTPGGLDVPPPGVLAGDLDPELAPLALAVADEPTRGTLALQQDGSFTYLPDDPAAPQDDTFTYTVSDGTTTSDPATVNLAICGGDAIDNGSFETGDLTGWCVEEGDNIYPPRVVRAGEPVPGLGDPEPADGEHAVITGFEARGPHATSRLFQLLDVPTGAGVGTLSLSWRARWDLTGCQGCAARTLRAVVTPLGVGPNPAPLLDRVLVRAEPDTTQTFNADTIDVEVDFAGVAGQRVQVALVLDLGDPLTGPAQLELDNLQVSVPVDDGDGGEDEVDLQITSPVAHGLVSLADTPTATGSARVEGGTDTVQVRLNGGAPVSATLGRGGSWTASGLGAWVEGTNTLTVDATANNGPTATASITVTAVADPSAFTCNGVQATMLGTAADDLILGTAGDDVILGLEGADTIEAGFGDDRVCAGPGDDDVNGGGGADVLYGEAGFDTILGGNGDDQLFGGADRDVLRGQGGRDTVSGGDGEDTLYGNDGADTIDGGDGDDVMYGGQAKDLMRGGDGDDALDGGPGPDTLRGDGGNDTLEGGDGDDRLFGGPGTDSCNGGAGANTLAPSCSP